MNRAGGFDGLKIGFYTARAAARGVLDLNPKVESEGFGMIGPGDCCERSRDRKAAETPIAAFRTETGC